MDFFSGMFSPHTSNAVGSARVSERYFEVNNFGYSRHLEKNIITNRPAGRPDYQMIYVKNGSLVATVEGAPLSVPTGYAILFRPTEPQIYYYTAGDHVEYVWFHFSGYGCEELIGGLFGERRSIAINNDYEMDKAIRDLSAHCKAGDAVGKEFACGRMIMLFAMLKRSAWYGDLAMDRVLTQLHREKFSEGSNAEYAKIAAMSESHFMRKFVSYTGMTPHRYKIKYLLRQAAELLCDTEMNIGDVSYAIGLDDSLYFSRIFKKEYGVSPLLYQKKVKQERVPEGVSPAVSKEAPRQGK